MGKILAVSLSPENSTAKTDFLEIWVRKNDTMSSIFRRFNLPVQELQALTTPKVRASLKRLYPGQRVRIILDEARKVSKILIHHAHNRTTEIVRKASTALVKEVAPQEPKLLRKILFKVNKTFSADAKNNGVSPKELAQVIQVVQEQGGVKLGQIKPNTAVSLVFENTQSGHNTKLIAIDLKHAKTHWSATRFQYHNAQPAYYHDDGNVLGGGLLRFPLTKFRISSGFAPRRVHPILHIVRPHWGIDLAAPIGSPVYATAAGKVKYVGNKTGYGRTVVLQHAHNLTTIYAHLSKYAAGLKKGDIISKKQIIGAVGKSGLATAPHLHYEVRRGDKAINPLSPTLPTSSKLSGKGLEFFKRFRKMLNIGD